MANNGWTKERRARQAAIIRRVKPWKSGTGPKSAAGKAKSKMNAFKHGGDMTSVKRLKRVMRVIEQMAIEKLRNEKSKEQK